MSNITILVTHPEVPKAGLDILGNKCKLVICESLPPQRSEILAKAKDVDGIFWATHDPLNAEVLDATGPTLKAISTMTAELDFVDIPTLKSRRMPLGYAPDIQDTAIANLAVGLMIAVTRRFHEGRVKIETGAWEPYHLNWMLGNDIQGAVVGFYGFEGVGSAIAKHLPGFDIQKIVYTSDKTEPSAADYQAEKVSFANLLKTSDIIFVTNSSNINQNKTVFDTEAFEKMKPTSVLINVSSGEIINEDSLYNALRTHQIFGAGIDGSHSEPMAKSNKLLELPNLVITPHIGSSTKRTRDDMAVIAANNVLQGIAGEPMFAPAYILPPEK